MITDHKFRPNLAGAGRDRYGLCAWRGTCNRPASEHAASVKTAVGTK